MDVTGLDPQALMKQYFKYKMISDTADPMFQSFLPQTEKQKLEDEDLHLRVLRERAMMGLQDDSAYEEAINPGKQNSLANPIMAYIMNKAKNSEGDGSITKFLHPGEGKAILKTAYAVDPITPLVKAEKYVRPNFLESILRRG